MFLNRNWRNLTGYRLAMLDMIEQIEQQYNSRHHILYFRNNVSNE